MLGVGRLQPTLLHAVSNDVVGKRHKSLRPCFPATSSSNSFIISSLLSQLPGSTREMRRVGNNVMKPRRGPRAWRSGLQDEAAGSPLHETFWYFLHRTL